MTDAQTGPRVVHIVLFRWKADASAEAIERALEGIRSLRHAIPGILDLAIGANFCDRAKGYHHGLVVTLENRAALDAYGPHPAHQRVVQELLQPIREDTLALDFEVA